MASESAEAAERRSPRRRSPGRGSTAADQSTADEAIHSPQEPETSDMIDATATTSTPPAHEVHGRPEPRHADRRRDLSRRDDGPLRRRRQDRRRGDPGRIRGRGRRTPPPRRRRRRRRARMVEGRDRADPRRDRGTHRRCARPALDGEMEQHAAVVEARVQRVGATVAAFEAEMAEFFERLLRRAGPDPHRGDGRADARAARPGRRRRRDRRADDAHRSSTAPSRSSTTRPPPRATAAR